MQLLVWALLALAASAQAQDEADLLLALPAACSENWENATAGLAGAAWAAGTPPCGGNAAEPWKGVVCSDAGAVTELHLGGTKIRCTGLPGELARLPNLQWLDMKCNALVGAIPAAWRAAGAFPSLQVLNLFDNLLTGSLADFTMPGARMMASLVMNVSRNAFNGGPLPLAWRSATLKALDVSNNMVPGTLPAQWAQPVDGQRSAFPALQVLAVQGNNLTGPYAIWPGTPPGSAVFAPNFTLTARPGNGLMEGVPAPSFAAAAGSASSAGLSAGAIAGIVVGAVACTALVAGLACFVTLRRRRRGVSSDALPPGEAPGSEKSWRGKDLEVGGAGKGGSSHGMGGLDSAGGSAWSSLAASSRPPGAASPQAASPHDSAMGSQPGSAGAAGADASSGHLSRGGSQGSLGSGLAPGLADTDARWLPGEGSNWSVVRFGDLELSHVLGRGSFGAVYLAKYCQTTVAVKMLGAEKKSEVTDSVHHRHVIRQLEKEAGIMKELRHPNVTAYMGACLDPPCLLMEHCSRRSVDTLLAAGLRDPKVAKQLSWPRLLGMALDAARGLLYLHTRSPPVYHRDFKSANLLVTAAWQVKVADFNLSRVQEGSHMSSVCIQNPRWLSPERLAGGAGGLPSDVWAFGTVMHELLTWEAPHGDQNAYQIIHAVQATAQGSGLAPPPADQLPAGPLGQYLAFVELMESCWRRDPAQRPSMEEVATRLRAMLAAEVGRLPSSRGGSLTASGTLPRLDSAQGSGPGSSGAAEPAQGSGSPFQQAAAAAAAPAEASPFAAAGASPFAAAGPAPAEEASPFEAAAGPADASRFAVAAGRGGALPHAPADGSPFGAAPAQAEVSPFAAVPEGASPFGVATPPPEVASPFAAEASLEPAASDAAASPFAAAAFAPPQRAGSLLPARQASGLPARQASAAAPAAQQRQASESAPEAAGAAGPAGGGFDSMANSVLASFARMEQVQQQLSVASAAGSKAGGTRPGGSCAQAPGLPC
ncbi:hypothetical protein ABPG75_009235 [Micractinium tetrahymenae]